MLSDETFPGLGADQANPQADLPGQSIPGGRMFKPEENASEDDPGVFEAIFGWISDLLASLFGNGGTSETVVAAEDRVEIYPDMSGDVIFNGLIPVFEVDEYGETGGDEDDDAGEFDLLI